MNSLNPSEIAKQRDDVLNTASKLRWKVGENIHDSIMESIYEQAAGISSKVVSKIGDKPKFDLDRAIDKLVTGKYTGFPIMFLLLAVVFWVTIIGSNIPSAFIASIF